MVVSVQPTFTVIVKYNHLLSLYGHYMGIEFVPGNIDICDESGDLDNRSGEQFWSVALVS